MIRLRFVLSFLGALIALSAFGQLSTGGLTAFGAYGFRESAESSALPFNVNAGANWSYVIRQDGTFVGWGEGDWHLQNFPSGLRRVKQISQSGFVNGGFTVALGLDGKVYAWGVDDAHGNLNVPADLTTATQVSAGSFHAAALKADGTVECWGFNGFGQCTPPANAVQIRQVSCGQQHTLAVTSGGAVLAWGDNEQGQCSVPAGLSGVVQVSAGFEHSAALKNNGTVVAWGFNNSGQINVPAGLKNVVQVVCGQFTTTCLKSDGTVVAWGDSSFGQTSPPALSSVVAISGSGNHTLALQANGTVVAWGNDPNHQCDVPTNWASQTFIANGGGDHGSYSLFGLANGSVLGWGDSAGGQLTLPANLGQVASLSASDFDVAAVRTNGTPICWGANENGNDNVPAGLTSARQVASGAEHTVAVDTLGNVYAWGLNASGQCNVPAGLTGVVQVAASQSNGGEFSAALTSGGTVSVWGGNTYGELNVPIGLANIAQIAAGGGHMLALSSSGTVVAWGDNFAGQCNVPAGLSNVVQIATDEFDSYALGSDGTLSAWGYNYNQGADDTPTNLPALGYVTGGGDMVAVAPKVRLSINSGSVASGTPATGTVYLATPAIGLGVTVSLASDTASVTVPATVNIPGGSQSATFSVTASAVSAPSVATISATMGAATNYAVVTNTPAKPVLATCTAKYGAIVGGSLQADVGVVSLSGLALSDTVVSLSSSDPSITMPTAVTISAGTQSGTFPITFNPTVGNVTVTLTASSGGVTKKLAVTNEELRATEVILSPKTAVWTQKVAGVVVLNADVDSATSVSLATSDATVATVPSSLTIPFGTNEGVFALTPQAVSSNSSATITASFNGAAVQATMAVDLPSLRSVTLPKQAYGLTQVKGTVTLATPSPQGAIISLQSNAQISVPSAVSIAAGSSSATFTATVLDVSSQGSASVTAGYNGASASATTSVIPNGVVLLAESQTTVVGGSTTVVTGKVTLAAAPTSDVLVSLSSDAPGAATVVPSVTVTAGSNSAKFTLATSVVASSTVAHISGSRVGISSSAALTVIPITIHSLTVAPSSVYGGSSTVVTGRVLVSEAPAAALVISLMSDTPGAASVGSTVTIAAGTTSATFVVTTYNVASTASVHISASLAGATVSAALTVNPIFADGLTLSTGSVKGGSATVVTGTVFSNVAPTSNLTVALSSDNEAVAGVPASVTILAGSRSATFTITTSVVATTTSVPLHSTLNGTTVSKTLVVTH